MRPARPSPAPVLAALLCAGALVLPAACGSDDQRTAAQSPAKAKPATTTESTSTETSPSTTTTTEGNGGVQPGNQDGGQPSGGVSGTSGASGSDDTPSHDVTPPANTPQGKFEQYCNQNPGACG